MIGRIKKIDCWELSDHIHKFHDGISQNLFKAYNNRSVDEVDMISRALAKNLLQREDIPNEVIERVEQCIHFFEMD